MEPEGSLPYSEDLASDPYPESDESIPYSDIPFPLNALYY
jgi:hypothetical protein